MVTKRTYSCSQHSGSTTQYYIGRLIRPQQVRISSHILRCGISSLTARGGHTGHRYPNK